MRSIGWIGGLGTILLACGAQEQGSGSTGTSSHALLIRISGAGTVQGASPPVSCRNDCRQDIEGGGTVLLIATADAGNSFAGWQGDCSGTAACSLTMNADHQVTATFSGSQPPPPRTFRVTVNATTGTGTGRVTSNPGGIDCPGTCTMTAQTGTSVGLTAQAAQDSRFAGWGGACHGSETCTLTASGDVWANFEKSVPPPQCAGLTPASPAPPVSVMVGGPYEPSCGPAMGDSLGTIALQTSDFVHMGSHAILVHFMDGNSGKEKNWTGRNGSNGSFGGWVPQPDGFIAIYNSGPYASSYLNLEYWNHEGRYVRSAASMWGNTVTKGAPLGGLLVAGIFGWTTEVAKKRQVWMFAQDLSLKWMSDLASQGTIFGLGCDVNNRCLIITDGGAHSISAQWLESNGTVLAGEFTLIKSFQAGMNTWFETAPLIGGGVAVRRVDQQNDASGRAYRTAQWLVTVTVTGGQAGVHDAPQWLRDRRDTNFGITRSGKAYAMLPMGAPDAGCAQKVEVLAADGTSCGSLDATLAAGRCRTEDVALSLDGTPIQPVPKELSKQDLCSYRWWKDALR
jgi:List-Bact-rpt repeat protein